MPVESILRIKGRGGGELLFVFCLLWGSWWIADYFLLQLVEPRPFDCVFDDDWVLLSLGQRWLWLLSS